MKVELSERARERVEELVRDGAYPSVEAAVEAAVDALDPNGRDLTHEDIEALVAGGYEDIAAGRVRPAEEVIAEARALVEAKASRRLGA